MNKCLKDQVQDTINESLSNIDDKFYDFINECDDIHDSISKLLGKVGN